MRALVADLDPIEALGVAYGLFEVLLPMIDETITKHRHTDANRRCRVSAGILAVTRRC
jgi:hypothetical protein